MFNKKYFLILLVTILLVNLSISSVFAEDTVSINVALEGGRQSDSASLVVEEFEKKYPDIKVNIIPLPYTSLMQQLNTVLSSGADTYDVIESHFLMNSSFIAADQLLPLDDLIEKYDMDINDFVDSTMKVGTLDGKAKEINPNGEIFGIPFTSDIMMMLYRKDLYEKYDLKYPQTWEEAYENMKIITEETGIPGFVFSGANTPSSHLIHDFYNIALNMEGNLYLGPNFQPQFNTEGNVKALKFMKKLVDEGLVTSGVGEYQYAEKNTMFAQGNAAHMSQFMLSAYNAVDLPENSEVAGKVGFGVVPGKKAIGGGWSLSIPKSSNNPDAAFKFIDFLVNSENDRDIALETGNGPVRKSAMRDSKFIDKFSFAEDLITALDSGLMGFENNPTVAIRPELNAVIQDAISDVIFEGADAEEAAANADKELENILKMNGYL